MQHAVQQVPKKGVEFGSYCLIHFSPLVDILTNLTSNGDEAKYRNSRVLLNLENVVGSQ